MSQNINLHSSTRRRRVLVSRAGVLTLCALALAAVSSLSLLESSRQAQLRAANADTDHAVARLEKQLGSTPNAAQHALEELNRAEVEVASLESVAAHLNSGALGRTTGFTAPLRALATGRTDGVWLTGIYFDNAGAQLALEGKALDPARVPALIERLRKLPLFSGTPIATLELKPAEEAGKQAPATLVRFRIATPTADTPAVGAKK